MLGWPTVLGQFHLWLKVGLYLPIEPEISGPHNSPCGKEGPPFVVGLLLSSGRYLPKMNLIRSRVSPQITRVTMGRTTHARTFSRYHLPTDRLRLTVGQNVKIFTQHEQTFDFVQIIHPFISRYPNKVTADIQFLANINIWLL